MIEQTPMLLLPQWTSQMTTRSGVALNIRPAAPSDRDAVLTFLRAVDPPDLRFRFLSAVKPSDALAEILVSVDHRMKEDLIAFDPNDGAIIATAMIAEGRSPELAEIAVLVRSDLKGLGIGWEMLSQACDCARARGFSRAECVESSSNVNAIKLENEQGFIARSDPGNADLTILTRDLA